MNNKDQENGARTGPLIFTVPAYGFVMALYLDWLRGSHLAAFPPNPLRKELNRLSQRGLNRRYTLVKKLILFFAKQFNQTAPPN